MKTQLSLLALLPVAALADTLELKNGTLLNGTYMGGTASALRFETAEGLQVIPRADALALTFTTAANPAVVVPAAAPAAAGEPVTPPIPTDKPAPAATAGTQVTVPAGTLLTVKLDDTLDARTAAGRKFGGRLVGDLVVNGVVAVRAGTAVIGETSEAKQGGKLIGKSSMVITLTGLQVDGAIVPIMTTDHTEKSENALKKTGRNAAVGALIGEATNNDAGGGAAIGAGTAVLGREKSLTIPAGTTLEFELNAPVTVPAAGNEPVLPAVRSPRELLAPESQTQPQPQLPRRGIRR